MVAPESIVSVVPDNTLIALALIVASCAPATYTFIVSSVAASKYVSPSESKINF